MNKIFIYSNSFKTNTILFCINYMLSIPIDEIVLLKENHMRNDFKGLHFKIKLFNSLNKCINNCNYVLLVNDENIQKEYNYIINTCTKLNIPLIKLDYSFKQDNLEKLISKIELINKKPIILHLFTDEIAQPLCTELMINKILTDYNVNFTQLFSSESSIVFNSISCLDFINQNIVNQMLSKSNNMSLFVISLNIGKNLQKLTNMIDLIKLIKADFLILNLDANLTNKKIIVDILNFGCMKNVDCIVRSNYFDYEYEYKIFKRINSNTIYSFDEHYESKLAKKIFEKLTLPPNVKRM